MISNVDFCVKIPVLLIVFRTNFLICSGKDERTPYFYIMPVINTQCIKLCIWND